MQEIDGRTYNGGKPVSMRYTAVFDGPERGQQAACHVYGVSRKAAEMAAWAELTKRDPRYATYSLASMVQSGW